MSITLTGVGGRHHIQFNRQGMLTHVNTGVPVSSRDVTCILLVRQHAANVEILLATPGVGHELMMRIPMIRAANLIGSRLRIRFN